MKIAFSLIVSVFFLSTSAAISFAAPGIYFSNNESGGTVETANLDGSSRAVIISDLTKVTAVKADLTNSKIIFYDQYRIRIANLNGSNLSDVIAPGGLDFVYGIDVDPATQTIYYTVGNAVKSVDYTGANRITVIATGVKNALGIALDRTHRKMYIADAANNGIYQANFDGSEFSQIVPAASATGVSVDVSGGKIYYTFGSNQVGSANLDGSNSKTIINQGGGTYRGITVDGTNKKIYYADPTTEQLFQANTSGANVVALLSGVNGFDVALGFVPTPSPTPKATVTVTPTKTVAGQPTATRTPIPNGTRTITPTKTATPIVSPTRSGSGGGGIIPETPVATATPFPTVSATSTPIGTAASAVVIPKVSLSGNKATFSITDTLAGTQTYYLEVINTLNERRLLQRKFSLSRGRGVIVVPSIQSGVYRTYTLVTAPGKEKRHSGFRKFRVR